MKEENNTNPEEESNLNKEEKTNPKEKQESSPPKKKKIKARSLQNASLKELIQNTWGAIWYRLSDLFSLHFDTDEAGTIDNIQKSIEFRGGNLWALLLAAVIASIGLNTNSTAVIIGAMLISPLMGPIVGVGYSIGTNDLETFKNSIRNLGVSVAVSIIAATIYFLLSPLDNETPELLARTAPSLYDVLIAICGGIIGIVAGSRKDRGNAIPGVAIATALMPPLCTVGYGLAKFKLDFLGGALFLFLINTVFIVTTTYIFVRVLRFPKKTFLDPRNEKRVSTIMLILAVVTIIPSTYFAYTQIQEEVFNNRVKYFVKEKFESDDFHINHPSTYLVKYEVYYDSEPSQIVVVFSGDRLTEEEIKLYKSDLKGHSLGNAELKIQQGSDFRKYLGSIENRGFEPELLEKVVDEKNEAITELRKRIEELTIIINEYKEKDVKIKEQQNDRVAKVVSMVFPEVEEYSCNKNNVKSVRMIDTLGNFIGHRLDTIPLVTIKLDQYTRFRDKDRKRLENLLEIQMGLDTIQLVISK